MTESRTPRPPSPPGKTIAESIHFLNMAPSEFARRVDVSLEFLEALIAGTEKISPDLAERLESVTGSPKAFWMMLESKYRRSL
jgi:addiction module HigA family antidote